MANALAERLARRLIKVEGRLHGWIEVEWNRLALFPGAIGTAVPSRQQSATRPAIEDTTNLQRASAGRRVSGERQPNHTVGCART